MVKDVPVQKLRVSATDAGQRLDRWLKRVMGTVPYIALQKLIRQGRVRVGGKKVAGDFRLQGGEEVTLPPDVRDERGDGAAAVYQVSKADVLMVEKATVFEDKWLLVLNKPAGLPAQAGGGQVRSLDRILAGIYGADKAPKLVHRLDRETTGLLVCAKNRTTAAALGEQFSGREVKKEYVALVAGKLPGANGKIDVPIAKAGAMAKVDEDGDKAVTTWRRVESLSPRLHVLVCTPHTGRMNQLRVHFAYKGFPIVGDDKYGFEKWRPVWDAERDGRGEAKPGLFLHAWKLDITHPQTGEKLMLTAPLPERLRVLTPVLAHGMLDLK